MQGSVVLLGQPRHTRGQQVPPLPAPWLPADSAFGGNGKTLQGREPRGSPSKAPSFSLFFLGQKGLKLKDQGKTNPSANRTLPANHWALPHKGCSSWLPKHFQLFHLLSPCPTEVLSGIAQGHPPPQPPTQAVFDPALLPLLHSSDFVWGFQHRNAATPGEEGSREVQHGTKVGRPGNKAAMLALLAVH